jgi:hypothetical protein
LQQAEETRKMCRYDPVYKDFAEAAYGLALVGTDSFEQQIEGIAIIEAFLEQYRNTPLHVWTVPVVLKAFIQVGLYDRGIEIAEEALENLRKVGFMTSLITPEVTFRTYSL